MFKRIINGAALAVLSLIALVFSLENNSIIFVNLFPLGIGIETPLWAYTIALLFIGTLFGILGAGIFGSRGENRK